MFLLPLSIALLAADGSSALEVQPAGLREPCAIVILENRLLVANRQSGTVSIVDPVRRAVLYETRVADRLSDLAIAPDRTSLIALDDARDEVLLLSHQENTLPVVSRLKVAKSPVTACVSERNKIVSVASLWARRLTLIQCTLHAPREDRLTRSVRSTNL